MCVLLLTACGRVTPAPPLSEPTAAAPMFVSGARVELVADAASVKVGESITVQILVRQVEGLYGLELALSYDPARLEPVDADADTPGVQIAHGEFLKPDFVAENRVDDAAGVIAYAVAQSAPAEPRSGEGVLARLEFRGKVAGAVRIAIDKLYLADVNGDTLDVSWEALSLTVE